MSNSRAKYEELSLEQGLHHPSPNQRSVQILIEILQAAHKVGVMDVLLEKAITISKDAPFLTASTTFQIAAEEAKVDELCN